MIFEYDDEQIICVSVNENTFETKTLQAMWLLMIQATNDLEQGERF